MPNHDLIEDALAILEDANAGIRSAVADIRTEVKRMFDEIESLENYLAEAEGERDDALREINNIKGTPELREAAELVMAMTERPVGKIHELAIADSPPARRALLMMSDALGRHIP